MWLILINWWISIHHHFPHANGHEFGYTMIYPISVSRPNTGCWPSVIADATLHRHFTQYHKLGSTLILKRWVEPCDATYLGVVEQHCGITPLWERLGFVSKVWGRGKWWDFWEGFKFWDNSSIHNDFRERSWLWSWCWQSLTCVCICVCVTIVFPSLALWKSCGKYTLNAHIRLWQQTELPMSVCMSYDATGNVSFFQFNDFANRPILLLLSAHLTSTLIQQGSHTPASQHLKQNPSCPSSNCRDLVAFQQQFLCFSAAEGSPTNLSGQINLLVPVLPEESLGEH